MREQETCKRCGFERGGLNDVTCACELLGIAEIEADRDDLKAKLSMAAETLGRSQRAVQAWRNWSDEAAPPWGSARDRSDAGQRQAISEALQQLSIVAERIHAMIPGARDPWSKVADVVDAERVLRGRAESAEADLTHLRALLAEACSTGREIAVIGLDLANGRAPSISTSEMFRSRMDRLAEIRKEGGL